MGEIRVSERVEYLRLSLTNRIIVIIMQRMTNVWVGIEQSACFPCSLILAKKEKNSMLLLASEEVGISRMP